MELDVLKDRINIVFIEGRLTRAGQDGEKPGKWWVSRRRMQHSADSDWPGMHACMLVTDCKYADALDGRSLASYYY